MSKRSRSTTLDYVVSKTSDPESDQTKNYKLRIIPNTDSIPTSVADTDPGSGAFLTPGSWIRDG
jgi:hypothetical protein